MPSSRTCKLVLTYKFYSLRSISSPTFTHKENYHKPSFTILQTKQQCQIIDVPIKNPAQSEIAQHQSESASHAPSPSKKLITPTEILESALKLYDMDVDCDFLKPSHESMEVNSAQPNIIAG